LICEKIDWEYAKYVYTRNAKEYDINKRIKYLKIIKRKGYIRLMEHVQKEAFGLICFKMKVKKILFKKDF